MPSSAAPGEMPQLLDETVTDKPSRMGRLRLTIWNRTVRVLCALALALVAFGHHHVETGPRLSDPQITAYVALGGSLADLCLSGDDEQDHAAHADCPACTIAKSMALAPACLAPSDLVVRSSHRAAWPETLVLTGHGPRAPPVRGPPSLQLI
jgi:hypothetical protein